MRWPIRPVSAVAFAVGVVAAAPFLAHNGIFEMAYAGGSGSATSEPLLIDGSYHEIRALTDPAILSGDEDHVLLTLSMVNVDSDPGIPVNGVEYGLRFADGHNTDVTLAALDVYSPGGEAAIMVVPTEGGQGTSGETAENGAWLASADLPVVLEAPVFLEGGMLYIYATVLSIDSQPVSPEDSTFEVMYSLGEYIPFTVEIDGTPSDFVFGTFFDRIDRFAYDEQTRTVSAYMPFTWTEEYIRSASYIHAEFYIPKTIPLFEDHAIMLAVNGMDYFGTVDRSGADETVIHYMLSTTKLLEMMHNLGPDPPDKMVFEMRAGEARSHSQQISSGASLEAGDVVIMETVGDADNAYHIHISAEPAGMINPGHEVTLSIEVRHADSGDLVPDATYDVELTLGEDTVLSAVGREVPAGGTDTVRVTFAGTGIAGLEVSHIGGTAASGKFSFVVSEPHDMSAMMDNMQGHSMKGMDNMQGHSMKGMDNTPAIPGWIKANAGWWSAGHIDDSTFVTGLEYLMRQGIVHVPNDLVPGSPDGENMSGQPAIPLWIKNSAGWWSEGLVSDGEFISSLEWMVTNGVIAL